MKVLIYAVPSLALIGFAATTILNWLHYAEYVESGGSAPFSAFVFANVILYLIPAAVVTLTLFLIRRIFGS